MIPPEPPVPPAPPPVPPPLAPSPALPPVPLLELDVSMRVVEEHVTEVADTTVAARTTGKAPFDTLMTSSSFRMVYSRSAMLSWFAAEVHTEMQRGASRPRETDLTPNPKNTLGLSTQ